MSKKKAPIIAFSQIEEALEERVNPDRRKADMGLPPNVHKDRRKRDRRGSDRKPPTA